VESTPTILVLLEQESNAKTCASLVLELRAQKTRWLQTCGSGEEVSLPHSPACLLGGWKSHAEIIRSSLKRKSQVLIPRDHLFSDIGGGADFETEVLGNYSHAERGKPSVGGGSRPR
jgi:hypothetical protein